ncbi:MAG: 50S ribosomal protein L15 [Candidatus Saccharimonadales bacterium]
MKYNELNITSHKNAKRVGRGIAAGGGKTAGRGTKGQNARTGGGVRPGFEGGQTPLMQRLPKLRGFRSIRTPAETIYTSQLEAFAGKTVDSQVLADAGLISSPYVAVKLLTNGELSKKVTVKLPGASASAIAMVQKAGGSFVVTERLGRPAKTASKKD